MNQVIRKSGGPKTKAGKANSAKNAIKIGIFSKGYLPWEGQVAKQAEFERLAREWKVDSPTGILFLRDIEQAQLAQERVMRMERLMIEGAMLSVEIASQFAYHAPIDPLLVSRLPSWFFLEDDGGQKERALLLDEVFRQADDLKNHYSDQRVAQVKTEYPELYEYIMDDLPQQSSFVMTLAQIFKQSQPTLNLGALMNEISEDFHFHLLWASNPSRFQGIIDGLRAQKIMELIDYDKSNRYMTSFQNRKIRAIQGLIGLQQHAKTNCSVDSHDRVLSIASETKAPPKMSESGAASDSLGDAT